VVRFPVVSAFAAIGSDWKNTNYHSSKDGTTLFLIIVMNGNLIRQSLYVWYCAGVEDIPVLINIADKLKHALDL
jgi:hypothetical protein